MELTHLTILAGHLADLSDGAVLASDGVMNPQIRFGEDLMSRVSYAMLHEGGAAEVDDDCPFGEKVGGAQCRIRREERGDTGIRRAFQQLPDHDRHRRRRVFGKLDIPLLRSEQHRRPFIEELHPSHRDLVLDVEIGGQRSFLPAGAEPCQHDQKNGGTAHYVPLLAFC